MITRLSRNTVLELIQQDPNFLFAAAITVNTKDAHRAVLEWCEENLESGFYFESGSFMFLTSSIKEEVNLIRLRWV
jgi:hypothetical protein